MARQSRYVPLVTLILTAIKSMLSIGGLTHTSGLTAAKVAHQAEPVCTDPKGSTPYELHKKIFASLLYDGV